MHCLYGGYNLHRFSDALGLVFFCQQLKAVVMRLQNFDHILKKKNGQHSRLFVNH